MSAPQPSQEPPAARFQRTHEPGEDTVVLTVQGDIDVITAPLLHDALVPVLEHERAAVVVDLCDVEFMDSSGVHVLFETLERLKAENRRMRIACREHGQVHRLLALVGLLDAVAVHRSRRSAVVGGEDRISARAGGSRPRRSFGHTFRTPPSSRAAFGPRRG